MDLEDVCSDWEVQTWAQTARKPEKEWRPRKGSKGGPHISGAQQEQELRMRCPASAVAGAGDPVGTSAASLSVVPP